MPDAAEIRVWKFMTWRFACGELTVWERWFWLYFQRTENPSKAFEWGRHVGNRVWEELSWPYGASLVAQTVNNLPAMQETQVQSLNWEDPPEKSMATRSSILAWKIPGTGEPGGLQPTGAQRVRHDWVPSASTSGWPHGGTGSGEASSGTVLRRAPWHSRQRSLGGSACPAGCAVGCLVPARIFRLFVLQCAPMERSHHPGLWCGHVILTVSGFQELFQQRSPIRERGPCDRHVNLRKQGDGDEKQTAQGEKCACFFLFLWDIYFDLFIWLQ